MRTAIVLTSLLAACGGNDIELGTQANPLPAQAAEGQGAYKVTNTVDFTAEQIAPAQVAGAVAGLREFSKNPARGIIVAADQAGVPAVKELYDGMPGPIKDRLEGWVNDEIEKIKIAGKPITEYAGQFAKYAEFALTQFAVESEMSFYGDKAVHQLTAVDLSPTGLTDVRVEITGLAADILTQEPAVEVGAAGAINFGEQHFGLMYGEYAWAGLEVASVKLFGQGIRASFGKAVNCPSLAQKIADKCYFSQCVGHETEIRQICEGGLDWIVNIAHNRVAAHKIEALHLATGDATLVDETGDGVADKIVDGVWEAEMNIGLGLRYAPATFVGQMSGGDVVQ